MTNEEVRAASGSVTTSDPLVIFLYLLMRDHLPSGVVEKLACDTTAHGVPCVFTNGWVANYAIHLAERLR